MKMFPTLACGRRIDLEDGVRYVLIAESLRRQKRCP